MTAPKYFNVKPEIRAAMIRAHRHFKREHPDGISNQFDTAISGGRNAFREGKSLNDNPYRKPPFKGSTDPEIKHCAENWHVGFNDQKDFGNPKNAAEVNAQLQILTGIKLK